MKVFAISDLHLSGENPKPMDIFGGAWDNYIEKIKASWDECVEDGDVVLISGDISWAMGLEEAKKDLSFIGSLKGKKVIIRGNHDYWWKSISAVRNALPAGVYAVQNDAVKTGNVIVCGSRGWTTPEKEHATADDKKIYEREIIRMEMSLKTAEKMKGENDKIVVMTHYPPFNSRIERSPFVEMFSGFKVDAVVYGHLHGKDCRASRLVEIDGIRYYLTSCDLVENKLVRIL